MAPLGTRIVPPGAFKKAPLESPAALLVPCSAVRIVGGAWVAGLVEDAGLVGAQMQADGAEVLLELLDATGAEDHRGDARTVDQPCQCHLCHRYAASARHALDSVD